ncbi:MAG: tetratricopeptide repeat protein [Bergeyella sp.]|nr:tetratricopeptide repeat protein [Bergeyella sp.]
MKAIIHFPKKSTVILIAGMFSGMFSGQTKEEGIKNVDSHKYAKARAIYSSMIEKSPKEADNYFYMGNTYIIQFEPNFEKAEEYFKKGLAADPKSYLNKIGLESIKLGRGELSAIKKIESIVKDSREKDPEVLYRAAEALTMYEKYNAPDLAIDYLTKAIEKSERKGAPAYYYYTLGDVYRLKKDPGKAMTSYEKASAIAENKASVYTRMATLWLAAKQWKLSKENIEKALREDSTYAPMYKAKAAFDIRYQQHALATKDLLNYAKYADEDPYTQLEIAKLFFINEDYSNAKNTLDKVFDKIDDPIKYKLKAYIDFSEGKYSDAKQDLDVFISKVSKDKVRTGDEGLMGLIDTGLAQSEPDENIKKQLLEEAKQKIAIAKAANDTTLKWDEEFAKVLSGGGASTAAAEAGPTNDEIRILKAKIAANPEDTDVLFKLGTAYQNVKNWDGAVLAWQKMIHLLPDWAPAYYSLGYAYQQMRKNELAKLAYESYIAKVPKETIEENKDSLSFAYFIVAYILQNADPAKAREYVVKSLELKPDYPDAVSLNKKLNP